MLLVDSHAHLHLLDASVNVNDVIERAKKNDVHYLLNVSVAISDFEALSALAERYPGVAISVGLHPNNQDEKIDDEQLAKLASAPKVIAIGETGLDYYRSTGDLEWQRDRFRSHIRVAKQMNKPIIVHSRAAKLDTIRLLREEQADRVRGVMHCFAEDWEMAQQALELGFYISFSGIVTFKNARAIQEVAMKMPLDRMLIETDCPYLAPEPMRGKPNEPAYVRYTAEYLAALRGVTLSELAIQTTSNFFTLFKEAEKPHV